MNDTTTKDMPPRHVARVAYTIPEICVRNAISTAKYHKLKNEGRGPAEMRDAMWIRISAEAEADWQREMTAPTGAEHIEARREAEAFTKSRGRQAGRLAAKSPKHVSKTRRARARVA